jgi:hypothetical protein
MGLFNFKKNQPILSTKRLKVQSTQDDNLLHLTKDGELPFGWIYRNKEFTDKIKSEYSYFLNLWLNSRNGSPKDRYATLKSFVMYLEDVEKLCKSKGECFEFWFYHVLTSPDYLEKRKEELKHLTTNLDQLLEKHIKKQQAKPNK